MEITWVTGSLLALAAVLAACTGAAVAAAVAIWKVSQQPPDALESALSQLRLERARDKTEIAGLVEQLADQGETLDRRRARAETAEQRRRQKEEKDAEEPQASPDPLEMVRRRARQLGKL